MSLLFVDGSTDPWARLMRGYPITSVAMVVGVAHPKEICMRMVSQ
jgi:hypothetical protein